MSQSEPKILLHLDCVKFERSAGGGSPGAPGELIPPGPTKEGIYTQIEKRWNLYPFGGGTYPLSKGLHNLSVS